MRDRGDPDRRQRDAWLSLPRPLASGLRLDAAKARSAIAAQVAPALRLPLEEAAYGAYLVGCAGIARAVRAVTIERGRDPRDFTLIAFGGNGPLFAAEVARSLEIATVLVPPAPGVFSAVGLLEAELEHHLVRTLNATLAELTDDAVNSAFEALADEAKDLMRDGPSPLIARAVDAKYVGQSFELTIPLPGPRTPAEAIAEIFAREHERTYGHRADGDPVQVVNIRIVARIPRDSFPSSLPRAESAMRNRFGGNKREANFGKPYGILATPVLDRFDLGHAEPRRGPLLIDEYDATTLVPPGCSVRLDDFNNIVIRIEA
jgi:N-methylhydantoinase A